MSVSLWRYTEDCNGNPCPGDCDLCDKEPEWIKDPDRPRAMRFKCPYCGNYCYDIFYADNKTIKCSYQFCPHCGADMRERKESKVRKCFGIPKDVAERLLEDTERKETNE